MAAEQHQAPIRRSITTGPQAHAQGSQPGSPTLSPVRSVWTNEEKTAHVKSLILPRLPREQQLLDVLSAAFVATPLPAPWVACRENRKRVVFMNSHTLKISLSSPLDEAMQELAALCRSCYHLPSAQRSAKMAALQERWDAEIAVEMAHWVPARDPSSGKAYHYHRKTKESMWQNPAEALLPAHYLRMKATELLRCADTPPETPDMVEEAMSRRASFDSGKEASRGVARNLNAQRSLLRSGSTMSSGSMC